MLYSGHMLYFGQSRRIFMIALCQGRARPWLADWPPGRAWVGARRGAWRPGRLLEHAS